MPGRGQRASLLLLLCAIPAGCFSRGGPASHDTFEDSGASLDQATGGDIDLSGSEGAPDLAAGGDLSSAPDLGMPKDMAMPAPEMAAPRDMRSALPCTRGTGFTAFRFKFQPGSVSARLEAFGLPDNSNWEAVVVRPTMIVDVANGGGVELGGGNWVLIRFSLNGLSRIRSATFSVRGRSYSVSTSGSFDAWSPLYGSIKSPVNSISNAWPYTWTSVDYTGNVRAGDPPGLTGIRLYPGPNSNNLVVNTVELCIDAD